MATWKPELHNIESIIAYYEQYDSAPYKVFAGHKPEESYCRFSYDENDKEIGREKLLAALQSVQSNPDNTNTYLLQICNVKGRKMEPVNSITFQLNKAQQYYPMQPQHISGMDAVMGKLNALEQRLAMQEAQDDDDDDEPEETNILNGIINSPQMQNLLLNVIANAFTGNKPAAVAGVPDQDKQNLLTEALQILKKNDPDLEMDLYKLATISEQNPEQFKFLISMLRKQ